MRKFYYLFLTMLLGMVGIAANAQDITVTVKVDDASHLKVYWVENYTTRHDIEAVGNVFTATVPQYTTLNYECEGDYLISSLKNNDVEDTYSKYKSSYSSYYYQTSTVDITTVLEDNVRTGVCIITIEDEPSQVTAQVSGSNTVFNSFEQKETMYKFIPDYETGISFNGVGNTPLYSVKYNGNEITKSGYYYSVTFDENATEHNIVINKNAPVGTKQNIKLSYADSGKGNGFITKVLVDNVEISSDEYLKEEGFDVNWGAKVDIYADVDNFKVNDVKINDVSTSFSGSTTFTATSDYVVVMDVEPYPAISVELTVNDASLVNVQKATYQDYGYGYGQWNTSSNISIENGTQSLSIVDKNDTPYIYITGNADCASLKVSVDGVDQDELTEGGYRVQAVEGIKINITAQPIVRDKKLIVYINDISKTYNGATLSSGQYPNTRSVTLANGYNEIEFFEGESFSLNIYASSVAAFYNGESFSSYNLTPADGDVLKYFLSSESGAAAPTANNVTFTLSGDEFTASDVTVTYDRVKTLSDLTAVLSAFAGTEVSIAANNNKMIDVKVNNEAVKADNEGNYVFTVNKATTVEIKDVTPTGINSINAENADNAIYTLQGVKVNGKAKGLYIKNGKKVVVK